MPSSRDRATHRDPDETITDDTVESATDVGSQVGRYHLVGRLGAGGGGTVFEAADPDLDRRVALKLIRVGERSDRKAARLVREAKVLAQLSHPNVITVLDVGRHQDFLFIAMELVEGASLDHWIEERPRTWDEVVAVYAQAAEGLHAAHKLGLVHRDFKPSNAMIDADGRVRVVDFGLALPSGEVEAPGASASTASFHHALGERLTRTGAMLGTPYYMAPEQFQLTAVTPATDQFAWSASLYEALYGHSPFFGVSISERSRSVLTEDPRPPPQDTQVPARIWQALRRGLATIPEQRWPSMDAAAHALIERPRTRTRRWVPIGLGLAAMGALAALPTGLSTPSPTTETEPVADHATTGSSALAQRAHLVRDLLRTEDYAQATRESHHICELATQAEDLEALLVCLSIEADALVGQEKEPEAQPVFERLYSVASSNDRHETAALAALRVAALRLDAMDRKEGGRWERHAAAALERTPSPPPSMLAKLNIIGARSARAEQDAPRAERKLRRAIRFFDEADHDEIAVHSEALRLLSVVLTETGRIEEAHEYLDADVVLQLEHYGPDHPDTLVARMNVGAAKALGGDYEGGYPILQEACDKLIDLDARYDQTRTCIFNLAVIESSNGNFEGARARFEMGIEQAEKAHGIDAPEVAQLRTELGIVLGRLGERDAAVAEHERAVTILEGTLGSDHDQTLLASVSQAEARAESGDLDGARSTLRKVLGAYEKHDAPRARWQRAAIALARVADDAEAIPLLEKIVAEPTLPDNDPHAVSEALFELGRRLFDTGQRGRGLALVRQARAFVEGASITQHDREGMLSTISDWQHTYAPNDTRPRR